MTELETRLRQSLERAAQDAPSAAGLAARIHARRRPRRKVAVGVGATLAAAGAVVAIVVVPGLAGPDRQPSRDASVAAQDGAWRTVEFSPEASGIPLAMEVPAAWGLYEDPGCELDTPVGPTNVDPCAEGAVTAMDQRLWSDSYAIPPGLIRYGRGAWSGSVFSGGVVVTVTAQDEETTRRVLASVRPADQRPPDVEDWRTKSVSNTYGEITAQLPEDPRVVLKIADQAPDCVKSASADGRFAAQPLTDDTWEAVLCYDLRGSVVAPTQALADLVAASASGY